MIIGNQNVFEVRSTVNAKCIGDQNVFEISCKNFCQLHHKNMLSPSTSLFRVGIVGKNVEVGNGTSFGAGTTVNPDECLSVPDNSVFYGDPLCYRIANDRPQVRRIFSMKIP